ncbi:uncharacterized protein DSM5745_09300 [Aspergillus mulundensis]|uniref:Uncharacterized protein n=1 Tax=Aspergillus mulundensis TaxID=1810919 RepID=A0A3D8R0S4_9EURO|nr:hypothetical protein DSM5745_09300 [Aspergillus mulundensis]RDW67434.1 hypothetical protein DSM5745_09300 [Aspergillus mulundensis]
MYQLTPDNLDTTPEDDTPLIRAATNANIAVLETCLTLYERLEKARQGRPLDSLRYGHIIRGLNPNTTVEILGRIGSPLNAAVAANLPDHKGNCAPCLSADLPRDRGASSWLCAVLDGARLSVRPAESRRPQRALTSLEVAAGDGNVEILDILRAGGADESAWVQPERNTGTGTGTGDVSATDQEKSSFDIRHGTDVPVSALSATSPVHEAIAAGRVRMLWHLLSTCGYSPNYRPRAAPTLALPPLSYALARCDLSDPGVQSWTLTSAPPSSTSTLSISPRRITTPTFSFGLPGSFQADSPRRNKRLWAIRSYTWSASRCMQGI